MKPRLILDFSYKRNASGWRWVLLRPGFDPKDIGAVSLLSVDHAIHKACEVINPRPHWVSRRNNRVLMFAGEPRRMTVMNGERRWNVYDLETGSAKELALNLPDKSTAERIAEKDLTV